MASFGSENRVGILIDTTSDTRDLKKTQKALDDVGDGAGQSGKRLQEFGKKAAVAAKRLALIGSAAAVAFGAKAVKNAIDLGESINAVEKTFGEASSAIFEFGKTADEQAGLSAAAFNKASVPIGAMLQNMGLSAEKAAAETVVLGQRAADVASVFNVDLNEALIAIQSGLRGESEPLKRFGVDLSETATKAFALADGLIEDGEEMDATTKATARLGAFLKQTNNFAGDFVDTSDQAANRQRILEARFENLSVAIGNMLLPVWEKMLEVGEFFVTNVMPKVGDAIEGVKRTFNQLWPQIKRTAEQVGEFLGPALKALWETISTELLPALNKLWQEVIQPLLPVLGGAFVLAVRAVVDVLNVLIDVISKLIGFVADFRGAFISLGAVLVGAKVVGAITAVKTALVGAGGLKAALMSTKAIAGNKALWANSFGIFSAVAIGAVEKVLRKFREMNDTLARTQEAISANEGSNTIARKRMNQKFKSGEISRDQYVNFLNNIDNFAKGVRNYSGGMALVGEEGPEIVNLPRGSDVFTNGESKRMVRGGDVDGGKAVENHFHAPIYLQTSEAVKEFFAMQDRNVALAQRGLSTGRLA